MSEERLPASVIEDFERLQRAGWSVDAPAAKSASMSALAGLAPPEPVASVSYLSRGRLLVIGARAAAEAAGARLQSELDVHLLTPGPSESQPPGMLAWHGEVQSLDGYLGAFAVTWLGAAGSHADAEPVALARAGDDVVVSVLGSQYRGSFDLVLDLSPVPLFDMPQPPQGYFAVGGDAARLDAACAELVQMVGEFEKPKFFAYKEKICAHSRSQKEGCHRCIDICSTRAISSDGDHVKVDPHLCMGCGACATVCPSGAMSYQYPRVADRGVQLKAMLGAYRQAGGTGACVLFHNATDGRDLLAVAAKTGQGLPGQVLPLESWHVASTGIDLLLSAVCLGASHVAVLAAGSETRQYLDALETEMTFGQTILHALGYAGRHFTLIRAGNVVDLHAAWPTSPEAKLPAAVATFVPGNDKRTTLEFAIEHLAKHAPVPQQEIALAAGAPYGAVRVDGAKCTLCMACTGACPESALMDSADYPRLKFVERNCVQCGLCVNTCPEQAITLQPRLLLTPQWKQEVVLNEAEPFDCIRCGTALGTKQMINSMLAKLAGHSMFQGDGKLLRLQMCANCRIVDMMENKNEMSILTGRPEAEDRA